MVWYHYATPTRHIIGHLRDDLLSQSLTGAKQESQLSQRDCVMIHVIEYFAKSLKVIRNDTLDYGVCRFVLVLRCNYVCYLAPFLRY